MKITENFDEKITEQILKGIEIPPQPQVLRVVMTEQQRDYPDLRKVAEAVAKDVGLSAAMLRATNSPAFGLRQKVSSIANAVMLLGMGNAVNLITGLSLRMVMSGKVKLKLDRFWNTAADTAIISSVLARRFGVMPADEAHMLGLFHDCGIPLLMQRFKNYKDILQQANTEPYESITTIEDRELKTNHATVGYIVARSWCLPEEIRAVILHHHDEDLLSDTDSEGNAFVHRIGLLMLAEHFSYIYHYTSNDVTWPRLENNLMRVFNLTETDIYDLSEDMKDLLARL